MEIKSLPGAGHGFRVSTGAGNFAKKFNAAVRHGDLNHLADNKEAIIKAVKAREGDIRVGKFNRLRQLSTYNKIKKAEGENLTKEDKIKIKEILKHLGGGDRSEAEIKKIATEKPEDKPVVPAKVRINRDPNNGYNFGELRPNVRAGVGDKRERIVAARVSSQLKAAKPGAPNNQAKTAPKVSFTSNIDNLY